jgi:molecular chaperone DnaK (HSP70)
VPLIHRNTPLPAQASQVFYRQSQDQDRIDIEVFQGESEDLNLCHSIGLFTLDKLTHSESKEVLCRFDLDRSGILTINVTDVGSARNLVRRIDQVQEVRSADLSDLTAVRLSAPLSVSADVTPDDYGNQRPDDGDDASVKNIDATADVRPADNQPVVPDLESLRERACAILARTSVDPLDAAELRDRLKSVENDVSPAARQTLADLVYFLE